MIAYEGEVKKEKFDMTEETTQTPANSKLIIPLHLPDQATAQIDPENIWAGDIGDREKVARTLIKLLGGQPGPLTTCLDGAWGSGKTFFLRRLCAMYSADKVEEKPSAPVAIYFNAWEDDSLDDPLIAIIGQLKKKLTGNSFAEIHDAITRNAKPLLAKAAFAFLKVVTKGVPVLGDMDLKAEDFESTNEILLDSYGKMTRSREGLRENLRRLADQVFEESGKPLLFVIDELDRCKPTVAIALLERVKHLFAVQHIVFLFGVDKTQLGHTIRAVYGKIDVNTYLMRFFEYTYVLPKLKASEMLKEEGRRCGLDEMVYAPGQQNARTIHDTFTQLALLMDVNDLQPRQSQLAVRICSHLYLSGSFSEVGLTEILAIAVTLKIKSPEHFTDFWDFNRDVFEMYQDFIPRDRPLPFNEQDGLLKILVVFFAVYISLKPSIDQQMAVENFITSLDVHGTRMEDVQNLPFLKPYDESVHQRFISNLRRLTSHWANYDISGSIAKIWDVLDLISLPSA